MAKAESIVEELEQVPEESGRSYGLLAFLLIIGILGLAIWFVMSQSETE